MCSKPAKIARCYSRTATKIFKTFFVHHKLRNRFKWTFKNFFLNYLDSLNVLVSDHPKKLKHFCFWYVFFAGTQKRYLLMIQSGYTFCAWWIHQVENSRVKHSASWKKNSPLQMDWSKISCRQQKSFGLHRVGGENVGIWPKIYFTL
jgi:hypothetical protein